MALLYNQNKYILNYIANISITYFQPTGCKLVYNTLNKLVQIKGIALLDLYVLLCCSNGT